MSREARKTAQIWASIEKMQKKEDDTNSHSDNGSDKNQIKRKKKKFKKTNEEEILYKKKNLFIPPKKKWVHQWEMNNPKDIIDIYKEKSIENQINSPKNEKIKKKQPKLTQNDEIDIKNSILQQNISLKDNENEKNELQIKFQHEIHQNTIETTSKTESQEMISSTLEEGEADEPGEVQEERNESNRDTIPPPKLTGRSESLSSISTESSDPRLSPSRNLKEEDGPMNAIGTRRKRKSLWDVGDPRLGDESNRKEMIRSKSSENRRWSNTGHSTTPTTTTASRRYQPFLKPRDTTRQSYATTSFPSR